jgi:hypothetical protein
VVRLDVFKSPELLATIYALRAIDTTLQKKVREYTKAVASPEWKKALARRADTRLEHRVIVDTAVVSVSNQNVRIQSAGKGRPLSGGLNPKTDYPAVEFGMNAKGVRYQRKSKRGGTHIVRRVIGTQFPARRREGPFWQSAREMVPRMASLWVQTTVKTIGYALEGKRE